MGCSGLGPPGFPGFPGCLAMGRSGLGFPGLPAVGFSGLWDTNLRAPSSPIAPGALLPSFLDLSATLGPRPPLLGVSRKFLTCCLLGRPFEGWAGRVATFLVPDGFVGLAEVLREGWEGFA